MKKKEPIESEIKGSRLKTATARGEGGTLLCYFRSLGMVKDSDTLMLYSNNHFYYDKNELSSISALLNLKRLNQIPHPARFIAQLAEIMPEGSCFSGYFKSIDTKFQDKKSFYSKFADIFLQIINPLKSGQKGLDKQKFIKMMVSKGFIVTDMSEINGLTYFCSKKSSHDPVLPGDLKTPYTEKY